MTDQPPQATKAGTPRAGREKQPGDPGKTPVFPVAKGDPGKTPVIAFSLAVHTSLPACVDLIQNLRAWAPDCLVVVHNSQNSSIDHLELCHLQSDRVIVCSQRLHNEKAAQRWCLRRIHAWNFRELENRRCCFDYFMMLASNCLLIRSPVDEVRGHEFGGSPIAVLGPEQRLWANSTTWWPSVVKDRRLRQYLADHRLPMGFCFHEGLYVSRPLMSWIVGQFDEMDRSAPAPEGWYPEEEIWFATLLVRYAKEHPDCSISHRKITFRDFDHHTSLSPELVLQLRQDPSQVVVKRVPMELDDPLRCYLRSLLPAPASSASARPRPLSGRLPRTPERPRATGQPHDAEPPARQLQASTKKRKKILPPSSIPMEVVRQQQRAQYHKP